MDWGMSTWTDWWSPGYWAHVKMLLKTHQNVLSWYHSSLLTAGGLNGCTQCNRRCCICNAWHTLDGYIKLYIYSFDLLLPLPSLCLYISVPLRKTSLVFSKSFSSVACNIWNKLPGHLSSVLTLPAFRKHLKYIPPFSPGLPWLYHASHLGCFHQ